jgi:small subunit ribosomal protein S6
MRNYEVAVLLHPDLEINIEAATKKIEQIITTAGGKVVKKDSWGKRKLAYPIKHQEWGLYVFYGVEMPAESVAKINQKFRITEEIMRYLVISLEDIMYINQPAPKEAKSAEKGEK